MENLRLYTRLIRAFMRGKMQYRADFIGGIVSILLLNTVQLGLIGTIAVRFKSIAGWSLWEMVFLYGLWMLGHSLYSLLFWHLHRLDDFIVHGRMDMFLTRPASVLLQFFAQGVQYMGAGDILVGIACVGLAYANLGLQWGALQWLLLVVCVISGAVIETSIIWMVGSVSFWTIRSQGLFWLAMDMNMLVQNYPIDIFGRWFQMVVTGLLPFAFMNYYPAVTLLGKGSGPWYGYLSPLVAVTVAGVAYAVWSTGLRRYSGTGS